MSLTWTQQNGYPSTKQGFAVAADSSGNVVASPSASIFRTTDGGVTWNTVSDPTSGALTSLCVAAANGVFLIGAGFGFIVARSTNGGASFSSVSAPSGWSGGNQYTLGLAYSPTLNKWIAAQTDLSTANVRVAVSSDNGATWGSLTLISGTAGGIVASGGRAVLWDGTQFVITTRASGQTWLLLTSPDGTTWTTTTLGTSAVSPGEANCITYANGIYLVGSREFLQLVESSSIAGFVNNAGYSGSSFLSGAKVMDVFSPDGSLWLCSSGTTNPAAVGETTKSPTAAGVWAASNISLPSGGYITFFCYDSAHSTLIAIGNTATGGIAFTAPYNTPAPPTTPTGGGSAGHGHGGEEREAQRHNHRMPAFGFYADQLRRQMLAKEPPAKSERKLNWVRHRD